MGQAELTYTNELYETAAQYCISLAKNHAFIDGNKRIAADCMLTFLLDLAQLLRTHSKPK